MRRISLAAALALLAHAASAEECLPTTNAAKIIAAAQARSAVALKDADALTFAMEARAQGIPMPDPDMVFLDIAAEKNEVEWLEGASARVSLTCSWAAKPASKFGQLIARWATR